MEVELFKTQYVTQSCLSIRPAPRDDAMGLCIYSVDCIRFVPRYSIMLHCATLEGQTRSKGAKCVKETTSVKIENGLIQKHV